MYTRDQQLKDLGLRPIHDLPNKHGFKFIGRMRTGHDRDCCVERDSDTGLHHVIGCEFGDLIGWKDRPK